MTARQPSRTNEHQGIEPLASILSRLLKERGLISEGGGNYPHGSAGDEVPDEPPRRHRVAAVAVPA